MFKGKKGWCLRGRAEGEGKREERNGRFEGMFEGRDRKIGMRRLHLRERKEERMKRLRCLKKGKKSHREIRDEETIIKRKNKLKVKQKNIVIPCT